ncbi:Triose-phosphate Transporter [Podila epigama]|nr:Triose-phosphate Transporter [Podila epigama]
MRDARENSLARRFSLQQPKRHSLSTPASPSSAIPSSSPSPSFSPSPPSPSTATATAPVQDRPARRVSFIHAASPLVDRLSSRKKNDDDNDYGIDLGLVNEAKDDKRDMDGGFATFRRDITASNNITTFTTTSSSSSSSSSTPPNSSSSPSLSGTTTSTTPSSLSTGQQQHQLDHQHQHQHTSTTASQKSQSSTATVHTIGRGHLGSLLASVSTHSPMNGPMIATTGSLTSTATTAKTQGRDNVFINIGQSASSLPQILMPKKKMAQNIAHNLSYIAAWYFFSTALSIYNKNLMGKDNLHFNLPLFVSSIHAGLHFVITACLMHFWPHVFDATRSGKGGRVTFHSYVTQVVPCAIAAALEIGMANASLMYITLSFYTMIKSSTPIWVLVFAFFFRLEKPRLSLILIIGVIVVGVVLTVAGETQFDMTGFILVLLASVMSGLRWSMTQMLLQKDALGMDNPVATLYYISPIMFVLMSILSLIVEDPFVEFGQSAFFSTLQDGMVTLLLVSGGGLLAFAMTVAEFKLIKNTGTVTLSVAGISKEIVIISLSMLIFGDRLTFVNLLGLFVSIAGIMAYNYYKIRKIQHSQYGGHGDYEIVRQHSKGDNSD